MKREELIAEVCHEANRMYCESIGDFSQQRWLDAPEWQRESAINGVNTLINNPGVSPSASHEVWLDYKLRDGWKYGPVKNPELKEHPCCVPYTKLPEAQKLKDVLFTAIAGTMVEMNNRQDVYLYALDLFDKTHGLLTGQSPSESSGDYLTELLRRNDASTLTAIATKAYYLVTGCGVVNECTSVNIPVDEYKELKRAKLYCGVLAEFGVDRWSFTPEKVRTRYEELCRKDGLLSDD